MFSYTRTFLRIPLYLVLLIQSTCAKGPGIRNKPKFFWVDESNFSLEEVLKKWKEKLDLSEKTSEKLSKSLSALKRKEQLMLYKVFGPLKSAYQREFLNTLAAEKRKDRTHILEAILHLNNGEKTKKYVGKICRGKSLGWYEKSHVAKILLFKGWYRPMTNFYENLQARLRKSNL